MVDFLSEEWFASVNQRLTSRAIPTDAVAGVRLVVIEILGAPSDTAHAVTLRVSESGATLSPGDHLAADTLIRIGFDDARRIQLGELDSASAIRDGRIKVRGDIGALLGLAGWFQDIFSSETP